MSSRRARTAPRLLILVAVAAAMAWPASRAGAALVVQRDVQAPDAIIMLGSHEWERLPVAAALARQHAAAILLITVPKIVTVHNCHRCAERVGWLEAEGVSRERIRVLAEVSNTYDEAMAARDYARSALFTRLMIVTSPYHTRRAFATFAKVFQGTGIDLGVIPTASPSAQPRHWWLDTHARNYIVYEWAAILKYRLQHAVVVFPPDLDPP